MQTVDDPVDPVAVLSLQKGSEAEILIAVPFALATDLVKVCFNG
jgi:hypothetical protein